MDWRSGKASRPLDPPFNAPPVSYEDAPDDESAYNRPVGHRDSAIDSASPRLDEYSSIPPSIPPISSPDGSTPQPGHYTSSASRPSMEVYGAFSDPVPSSYSNLNPYSQTESNRVSRTMQYADPYAAVKASLQPPPPPGPPSYGHNEEY